MSASYSECCLSIFLLQGCAPLSFMFPVLLSSIDYSLHRPEAVTVNISSTYFCQVQFCYWDIMGVQITIHINVYSTSSVSWIAIAAYINVNGDVDVLQLSVIFHRTAGFNSDIYKVAQIKLLMTNSTWLPVDNISIIHMVNTEILGNVPVHNFKT